MMQTGYIYDEVPRSASRFTGKERDSETGLDYFGARYYGSTMGRFLTPDEFTGGPMDVFDDDPVPPSPLPFADITNPQSLNKYSYTFNNPLRYTDPDGHCVFAGVDTLVCYAAVTATVAVTAAVLASPAGQQALRTAGELLRDGISALQKVEPFEVGTYGDLGGRSKGDNIDAHKVPQAGPASQTIPGYDKKTAPAIALPVDQHKKIPVDRGEAKRNPRDQTAKDVKDLRKHTDAPRSQVQKLVKKIKQTYPDSMKKVPKPD